jgi:hypothetical protein
MPLPTSYSEDAFAEYLERDLGEVATSIGWDAGSLQVLEAVNDALLQYGTTDITGVVGSSALRTLRALGSRAIWRAVVKHVATRYDFTDIGQQKFTRSQIQEMALAALKVAEAECAEVGVGASGLSVGRLTLDFLEPVTQWG